MSPDAIASMMAAVATGGFAAWGARSARRTKRQERRDDFTAITEQQGKAIERLEKRIALREAEAEQQKIRLTGQDFTIRYLTGWVRSLYGYMRKTGIEPPGAPQPMPTEVRQYLDDIGV